MDDEKLFGIEFSKILIKTGNLDGITIPDKWQLKYYHKFLS